MNFISRITDPHYWTIILLALPGMLMGLTFHEFAHAWMANKLGDSTAKMMGRLSLNPMRHLSLVGTLAIIFFGFGWAKPVPISPDNFNNRKRGTILVSLAGPASNLILALAFAAISRIIALTPFSLTSFGTYLIVILGLAVFYNVILALFNLIPIPPLDGSQIFFSLISLKHIKVVLWLQKYGFILLIILMLSGLLSILIVKPAFFLTSFMIGNNPFNIPSF